MNNFDTSATFERLTATPQLAITLALGPLEGLEREVWAYFDANTSSEPTDEELDEMVNPMFVEYEELHQALKAWTKNYLGIQA